MIKRWIGITVLCAAGALSGCNISFAPESTPTFAPSATPTPSPTTAPTQIVLLATSTHTPTITPTASPTETPTASPTTTPPRTSTRVGRATASRTASTTPSATATQTRTPAPTATPAATDTPRPTNTVRPTALPLFSAPTATPTLSPTPTQTATLFPTNFPTATNRPTNTPVPPTTAPSATIDSAALTMQALFDRAQQALTDTPRTPTRAPTLNVTPTFVTAAADTPVSPLASPLPNDGTGDGATATPTPMPTVALSVPIPPTVSRALVPVSRGASNPPSPRNFVIGSGTGVSFGSLSGIVPGTVLYQQNPANPLVFAGVNPDGSLYLQPDVRNGPEGARTMTCWPLDAGTLSVSALSWSANGRWLAFVTVGRTGDANPNGVFVIDWSAVAGGDCTASSITYVMPNCPTACEPSLRYRTVRTVKWAPTGDALILEAEPSDIGRRGVFVRSPFQQNDGSAPYAYDYGNWSVDGSRILVSGANAEGRWVIAWIDRAGNLLETVFDGSAAGLYVRDAVERPGGGVLALAGSDPGSPVRLITGGGQFISGPIGDAAPSLVVWNAARNTVGLTVNGRRYVVNVSGVITELEPGNQPVNFLDTTSNTNAVTEEAPPEVFVPSGVVEGSVYTPGQQVQYIGAEVLNVRAAPAGQILGTMQPGSYVVILAGPADFGSLVWWQVQTADGIVGWIAGTINGYSVLSP